MNEQLQSAALGFQSVPYHTHDGVNSPQLSPLSSQGLPFYVTYVIPGIQARQNSSFDVFFLAHSIHTITEVKVRYAGKADNACTLDIVTITDGNDITSGTSILPSKFDMNTTINTVQTKSMNAILPAGTALGALRGGNLNNLLHVVIEVYLS